MKVFIGPTGVGLDLDGVNVAPPAQQGDITSALLSGEDTIVLIDGYFTQNLAPFHKEITFAAKMGAKIIGAGSLGAIRAAECERYGMQPVGVIANWYKFGVCVDDADVALIHWPAEYGYKPRTVPLVNIRATAQEMQRLKIVSSVDEVVNQAAKIHYSERTWESLLELMGDLGRDIMELYVDQKALDAREAIEFAKSAEHVHFDEPKNSLNDCMYALMLNDVPAKDGTRPWERAVLRDEALNFWLISEMASALGMRATKHDVAQESEKMWRRLGVSTEEDAQKWMAENKVTEEKWNVFAAKRALVERSKDWFNATSKASQLVPMTLEYQLFNGL